jgi:hypothetical protein
VFHILIPRGLREYVKKTGKEIQHLVSFFLSFCFFLTEVKGTAIHMFSAHASLVFSVHSPFSFAHVLIIPVCIILSLARFRDHIRITLETLVMRFYDADIDRVEFPNGLLLLVASKR